MERDFSVCRAEGSIVFIRRIQERAKVIDIIEKIGRVAAVTLQGWGCKAEVMSGFRQKSRNTEDMVQMLAMEPP